MDLVGGRRPEYHVIIDPIRLGAANLTLAEITGALTAGNLVQSTGMHEENHTLYLTVVDGRVHGIADIVCRRRMRCDQWINIWFQTT